MLGESLIFRLISHKLELLFSLYLDIGLCNVCVMIVTEILHKHFTNQYQGTKKTITQAYEVLIGILNFPPAFKPDP
jgi:hypothetical protein